MFQRTLIYYDTDTESANFRGNSLCQATKWHLNNSLMVKNNEKLDEKGNNLFCLKKNDLKQECLLAL